MCLHVWAVRLYPLNTFVQHGDELGILRCLAAAKRRGQHHNGTGHIGREDIAVVHLVAELLLRLLQFLQERVEKPERVAPDVLAEHAAGKEHQGVQVILEPVVYEAGQGQQTIHPPVVVLP